MVESLIELVISDRRPERHWSRLEVVVVIVMGRIVDTVCCTAIPGILFELYKASATVQSETYRATYTIEIAVAISPPREASSPPASKPKIFPS